MGGDLRLRCDLERKRERELRPLFGSLHTPLHTGQVSKTSPGQQNGTASSCKGIRDQDPHVWREDSERKRKHFLDRWDPGHLG